MCEWKLLEAAAQQKPKRVKEYKADVVRENERLRMRVHQLEVELRELRKAPLWRRLWLAVVFDGDRSR